MLETYEHHTGYHSFSKEHFINTWLRERCLIPTLGNWPNIILTHLLCFMLSFFFLNNRQSTLLTGVGQNSRTLCT